MLKTVLFFLTLVLACFWRGPLPAASFDCQKAKASVEKIICSDEKLSSLDEKMDLRFTQALSSAADQEEFLRTQKGWLEERNGCESEKCVRSLYVRRLKELQKGLPKLTVSPAPNGAQIQEMLIKNYGLSAFASGERGNPCLLKNCGRAGPFPDLPSVCNHLRRQFGKEMPDGELKTCRLKKIRDEYSAITQPASFKNSDAEGILDAFVFPVEILKDRYLEVDFLAIQTNRGWWLVDELAQADLGGSMGVSGGFEAKRGEYLQLIPKGSREFALTFSRGQTNLDHGLGAQSVFSHESFLICKADEGVPVCSSKIPSSIIQRRDVVVGSDEEIEKMRREQKSALYHHEVRIRRAYDPDKGTITLILQKGKLPPELAPFIGTFKIEDLLGWQTRGTQ